MINKYAYLDQLDDYLDNISDHSIRIGVAMRDTMMNPEIRKKLSIAASNQMQDPNLRFRYSEQLKNQKSDPEFERKRIACLINDDVQQQRILKIIQYVYIATNIKTGEILKFRGAKEMANHPLKFNHGHASKCCTGARSSHKGYTWRREIINKE